MRRLIASLMLLAACSSSTPPPAQTEPAAQSAVETPTETKHSPCVASCIEKRQMRAVSAQQIENDCKRECTELDKTDTE